MFVHLYQYRLKTIIRSKEEFFWILLFPILLGTFFYVAFSNISKSTENFSTIPVAVALDDEDTFFQSYLDALSGDASSILEITYTDDEEAEQLLKNEKVTGIITSQNGEVTLTISQSGIYQSILKEIVDGYIQSYDVIHSVDLSDNSKLELVLSKLSSNQDYIRNLDFTNGNTDIFVDYYYSLIAMACLFAAFSGQSCADGILANLSPQGMRKCLSPVHRMTMILADITASCTFPIIANVAVIIYLSYILKVNLGGSMPLIFATSVLGTIIGVTVGLCVGSIYKIKKEAKIGLLTALSLFSSFLSGLMVGGIKYDIEKHAPFINKLNPATVITDALYSLNIYDTYEKYITCMIILAVMSVVLCMISYFMIRREYYADL